MFFCSKIAPCWAQATTPHVLASIDQVSLASSFGVHSRMQCSVENKYRSKKIYPDLSMIIQRTRARSRQEELPSVCFCFGPYRFEGYRLHPSA